MKLLTIENAKTTKGESLGYLTGILYLAPYNLSGVNLCPKASQGCAAACLNTAGRGRFDSIQKARLKKTNWYLQNRESFLTQLQKDIDALVRKAKRESLKPCVRLNGTSDIPWELTTNVIQNNPSVQFYDYTKIIKRLERPIPGNYHLTFSRSESNHTDTAKALQLGYNVAMVFDIMPNDYNGIPVIDGTLHDLRFLDARGVIVGLLAKGKAKNDLTGFVIRDTIQVINKQSA